MRLVGTTMLVAALLLGVAGCGGDNLELCNGCSATPTPTATPSPTSTALTPTPTSSTPTATSTP